MFNPQQWQQQSDDHSSMQKNQGIKSILQRFKTNSQIINFSNFFTAFVNKCQYQFNSQQIYHGNASDLWGLLAFQIKSINVILFQQSKDVHTFKKIIAIGQVYMFQKASTKINNNQIKSYFQSLYKDKISKIIQNINKQKEQLAHNQQSHMKKINLLDPKANFMDQSLNQVKNYNELISNCFREINSFNFNEKDTQILLKYFLKQLLLIVKKGRLSQNNRKVKARIMIICLQLLFALRNSSWKKLCLSQFPVTDFVIKYLSQKNGAMKIGKFLHDACIEILQSQLKKFSACAFKQ